MNREQVLEDILRDRAADVEVDAGALAAILNAPNPHSANEKQQRSNQQAQPAPSTPLPGAAATASSAASGGGSFVGKLAGFFGATALVGAIAVGGGAVYLNSSPQCPALDSALQTVNDEVLANVGENPNISLWCDGAVTSLSDIRSNLAPENQDKFDENLDEIEAAHACLTDAAAPMGITSVLDLLTSECISS